MDIIEIETFLTVVKTGNISSAAKKLYVSQSTISQRIKNLEEKLNYKLLIREKGNKTVELTPLGKEFLVIAEQLNSFWIDMKNLKKAKPFNTISIGSVDSLNNHSFVPLYIYLLDREKNLDLHINTYHSYEIHFLLESHIIDIGYVFSKVHNKNLVTKSIYSEKMYLICHRNSPYYNNIEVDKLLRKNEVFLIWGPNYLQWHDRFWDPNEKPYVKVNTGSMLINYLLHKKDSWAIAPISIIKSFQKHEDLVYYSVSPEPPLHTCYQLIHRYPKPSRQKGINVFLKHLDNYLLTCDWIEEVISVPSKR